METKEERKERYAREKYNHSICPHCFTDCWGMTMLGGNDEPESDYKCNNYHCYFCGARGRAIELISEDKGKVVTITEEELKSKEDLILFSKYSKLLKVVK
jgi:hypothetical protein